MDELKTVRREREMTQLWQAFQALDRGCCQLRFIPGEAGTRVNLCCWRCLPGNWKKKRKIP